MLNPEPNGREGQQQNLTYLKREPQIDKPALLLEL